MKLAYPTAHGAICEWLNRIGDDIAKRHPRYLNVYSPNRRVFADGNVLYSYGTHFPLARWIPEHRLLTLNVDRYSNTTSKQQSYLETMSRYVKERLECDILHLSYETRFQAWLIDMFPKEVVAYYDQRIRDRAAKAHRARSEHTRSWHSRRTMEWIAERNIVTRKFVPELAELPEDVAAALVLMKLTEK